jgi:hypothetical protein
MKQIITPIALLAAMVAGSASAQETVLFEDIDSNHNGSISMDEAKASGLAENFAKIDSNSDNGISVDEYTAYMNEGRLVPEEVEVPEPGAAPVMR